MRILISGICGFVGSCLAGELKIRMGAEVFGFDNYIRPGSELNRIALRQQDIRTFHADVRCPSDMENLPEADWVIDAAANPVVTAGVVGSTSSRQLVEHNLTGTINLLEHCRRVKAGMILLSTSRVYSIEPLAKLKTSLQGKAYAPELSSIACRGLSEAGVSELFPTGAPLSLYGATKLASEVMALEYAAAFGFPIWVDRCGVIGGAGQFGRADQGIFSYWIHSWRHRRPLKYIGFEGHGYQVRDCLHPEDLADLIVRQISEPSSERPRICNCSGGAGNSVSLAQVSDWCAQRFGPHEVQSDACTRPYDVPWLVLDSGLAGDLWSWTPQRTVRSILEEIAQHAEQNEHWLDISSP